VGEGVKVEVRSGTAPELVLQLQLQRRRGLERGGVGAGPNGDTEGDRGEGVVEATP
jgi:hypothetical protein